MVPVLALPRNRSAPENVARRRSVRSACSTRPQDRHIGAPLSGCALHASSRGTIPPVRSSDSAWTPDAILLGWRRHKTGPCGVPMGEMHARPAERPRPQGCDDGWFDALYPHLHRVACVVAPAGVDPDDLVQDALVNYLQLDNPTAVRSPRAFLTTTIVNLASNERRSWSRRRSAVARVGTSDHSRNQFPSDLADLLALPPRERAALYLHHVDGLQYDEVARLVGCTPAAARKAAERGRARLATALAEEGNR